MVLVTGLQTAWRFVVDRWVDWRVSRAARAGTYDNPDSIYRRRQRQARMTGEDL